MNNLKPMVMVMIMLTSILAGCTSSDTTDLDQQIIDLQLSNDELTAQLESADENIALMNGISLELEASLLSANTSLDNLNFQITQNEESINELTSQRDSLQVDLDEAIESNSSTISLLESQLEVLSQQITQFTSDISDLNGQLEVTRDEITVLTNSLNALSNSVSKLMYQLFTDIQGCSLNNPSPKLKIGFDDGQGPGSPNDGILQGAEVAMVFGECSESTGIVADISNSNPGLSQLVEMGGILYFTADDGVHGNELWRTDGTIGGTFMVIDLSPPMCSTCANMDSDIGELVAGDSHLFFSSTIMSSGPPDLIRELFVSDGTEAGTELVLDIFNCPTSSGDVVFNYEGVNSLLAIPGSSLGPSGQDKVVFSAFECSMVNWVCFGEEAWVSDGTAAGTREMADIRFGDTPLTTADGQGVIIDSIGSQPRSFFQSDDRIYFTADDNISGREVWKVNLSQISSGAIMVKDINSGSDDSIDFETETDFTQMGENIFFTADDGITGIELWKTNGFGLGTTIVKNINPGSTSSDPIDLNVVGNILYFIVYNSATSENELWKSNGTSAGTVIVDSSVYNPGELTVVGNTLYFTAYNNLTGENILWKSDGTSAGTVIVDESPNNPVKLTVLENKIYFTTQNSGLGFNALWESDGTNAGTVIADSSVSNPDDLTVVGNTIYYTGIDTHDLSPRDLRYHVDFSGSFITL